nr:unnamed protein product [Digitaria exilis]
MDLLVPSCHGPAQREKRDCQRMDEDGDKDWEDEVVILLWMVSGFGEGRGRISAHESTPPSRGNRPGNCVVRLHAARASARLRRGERHRRHLRREKRKDRERERRWLGSERSGVWRTSKTGRVGDSGGWAARGQRRAGVDV